MIVGEIRLYTWADVERAIMLRKQQNGLPEWLVRADAYWDGLHVAVQEGKCSEATDWLGDIFNPRFRANGSRPPAGAVLLLEGRDDQPREYPVEIEETTEAPREQPFVPTFARPPVIWNAPVATPPDVLPEGSPPIVCFHSFKGGVGRTCAAIMLALSCRDRGHKCLLIDGDLEAPGISWQLAKRMPQPPIGYADLLALLHADPEREGAIATGIVADRLQNMFIDGICFLPAFRDLRAINDLQVRPENLIGLSGRTFALADAIARIATNIEVDLVIVDLRAGVTELAAGFLLDPRVDSVFVSSTAGQSVSGTLALLDLIVELSASQDSWRRRTLILNQVTNDYRASVRFQQALQSFYTRLGGSETGDEDRVLVLPFREELVGLPDDWDLATDLLGTKAGASAVDPLLDRLSPGLTVNPSEAEPAQQQVSITERRHRLAEEARRLVFAETGEGQEFLATSSLRNLASNHRSTLPTAVVVGAKGAGKTYTHLQLARLGSWQEFVRDAAGAEALADAVVFPFLSSSNLTGKALDTVTVQRSRVINELSFGPTGFDDSAVRDAIREALKRNLHDGEWRDLWLDLIAWTVGVGTSRAGSGRNLIPELARLDNHAVVVIDGLEDLFVNFATSPSDQAALRAILQEVPNWLQAQPDRRIGIVVFVRQDMVLAAVTQNSGQFLARHANYALRWNRAEALRLALWLAGRADPSLSQVPVSDILTASEEHLGDRLHALWGRKLGHDQSREGRSSEWVLAALSDLKGQIQARDLVRLIGEAAGRSEKDLGWTDRLLVPSAIREAIKVCSEQKIAEIEQENATLKRIFGLIRAKDPPELTIPFTGESLGLASEDLALLDANGVVLRDQDEYYMPEIFRLGLRFTYKAGARPRVLALARAVPTRQ